MTSQACLPAGGSVVVARAVGVERGVDVRGLAADFVKHTACRAPAVDPFEARHAAVWTSQALIARCLNVARGMTAPPLFMLLHHSPLPNSAAAEGGSHAVT